MSKSTSSVLRPSGVEWLGDVPSHWEVASGRRVFEAKREPALESDEQLSATQRYGVVPQREFMEREDQKVMLALSGVGNFKHVERDDFVISLRSFEGGIEHSAFTGCVSPAYTVLRFRNEGEPSYFKYLLKSGPYVAALQSTTDSLRDGKSIKYEQFGSIPIPLPPLPEQAAIAAFLDRETGKIDALVAEQKRLIELLKEKRQAVISHAVTRGLDPNTHMKPSGVEWLGDVPEHWEVKRLKSLVDLIDGDRSSAYPSDNDIVESGVPFLSSRNIVDYRFTDTDLKFITPEKFQSLSRGKIEHGDLAITVRGTIGHVALFDQDLIGHPTGFINAQLMIMRPRNIASGFLHSVTESSAWQKQLEVAAYGTAQQQLSNGVLREFTVAVPPAEEQIAIGQFLASTLRSMDELVAAAVHGIELLIERRAALISETVTGKIDLRHRTAHEDAA